MKKSLSFLLVIVLLLTGCASSDDDTALSGSSAGASAPSSGSTHNQDVSAPNDNLVEISEKLFIAQTNDIYINTDDYLGKTIKYEGLFKSMYWPEAGKDIHFVIRYGPGCCGYDGEAGFQVAWDGEWPKEDDWCEAVGVLELYEVKGLQYLRLALTSLTVLDERGAEYVST
jgi:uncharacterized membrane protein YcgQ (UPF0703/DUF1980 family)